MFVKSNTLKNEEIFIDNGCLMPVQVSLSINQDDKSVLVTVEDLNDEDIFFYWDFVVDKCFGMYFDIRNVIDFVIKQSDNIGEFIEMLNEVFENEFYDRLMGSSYIDGFSMNGCEDCEKKGNCEEYLKHRN